MDFSSFVIAGPNTLTATVSKMVNGVIGAGGKAFNLATQCLTDTFSVTGPSGSVPPVICGTNTGEHSEHNENKLCFYCRAKLNFSKSFQCMLTPVMPAMP